MTLSLMDEYKLILDHYYNDDKAYWTAITWFLVINGALLSVFTSTFFAGLRIYRMVFCILGMAISVLGFFILVRIRVHRQSAIERGLEIENILKETNTEFVGVFHSADQYGYSRNRVYKRIQSVHALKLLLTVPLLMIVIWSCLLISSVYLPKIRGDINGDESVDMSDMIMITRRLGSSYGTPGYNRDCDLNLDNEINIVDIAIVAKEFGERG